MQQEIQLSNQLIHCSHRDRCANDYVRALGRNFAGRYYTIGNLAGDDTTVEVFTPPWRILPKGLINPLCIGAVVVIE